MNSAVGRGRNAVAEIQKNMLIARGCASSDQKYETTFASQSRTFPGATHEPKAVNTAFERSSHN